VVRYSFTVVDFHHLLLAGFAGALSRYAGDRGLRRIIRCRASCKLLDWLRATSGDPHHNVLGLLAA
jgi:hypothetical protein